MMDYTISKKLPNFLMFEDLTEPFKILTFVLFYKFPSLEAADLRLSHAV